MPQDQTTKGWFVIDHIDGPLVNLVEVVPEMDIREHVTCVSCECIPIMSSNIQGIPLLVHNSFDGRESNEYKQAGH